MSKNGKFFVAVIGVQDFVSTVWDPYAYRDNEGHTLSHYAAIHKVAMATATPAAMPFEPLEYRDIPHGSYLSFVLREKRQPDYNEMFLSLPAVGENELLFGTMRAYLGNVLVTPRAEWVHQTAPLYFPVKSEFVVIAPHDGLPYFWLAYLRSRPFLENLPIGSGGTRPRLQAKSLGEVPVTVPPLKQRTEIHAQLKELARAEWQNYFCVISTLALVTDKI